MQLREVTLLAVVLRMVAAVILGGFIGLERGLKNRPAGLRTYMVVCMGACLMMLTNQYIYQVFGSGDPVRMGAQVVSGIGFLGAGTIVVTRRSQIKGLTTAAGLWAAAGVGLALGIGFYEAALAGSIAIFFVMTLLQRLDNRMHRKLRSIDVYFELEQEVSLGDFIRNARNLELEVRDVHRESGSELDGKAYIATLKSARRRYPLEITESAGALPGVVFLEEI